MLWTGAASSIGLLVGLFIAILISIKRRWFWLNSLIAFLAFFLLMRFDLLGWNIMKNIFLAPGQITSNTTIEFLINGTILLSMGIFILSFKPLNRFIESRKIVTPRSQLTNILLISILMTSCGSNIEDILPKYKIGIEHLSKEIGSEISFAELAIQTTKSESSGERTSRNLNVVLTDASIKMFIPEDLELLSARISSIVKRNVTNIDSYDWVSIHYQTSDGSNASDSTDKAAYVFRPGEIK